jgi:ketosteroid isomerase-like protein
MAQESLEKRVERLEAENKKLRHEMERSQAVTEIMNLISRMQAYHTANRNELMPSLYAKKAPDVRLYWGELGSWEGPDGPAKAGKTFEHMGPGGNAGMMAIHLMGNPMIEVAGDGKTARGIWVAAGMVANKRGGQPTAMWEWNRYGIDFIKEDGQWKLWHHHVYPLFQVGWDQKWAEQFPRKAVGIKFTEETKPNHPATPLDVFYSPDEELPYIPVPEPYETFDPANMY